MRAHSPPVPTPPPSRRHARALAEVVPKARLHERRVAGSSGWPDERNTLWTIGGTPDSSACPAGRRCSRFARHAAHSPSMPGEPPHAHLRCKNRVRPRDVTDMLGWWYSFITHPPALGRSTSRRRHATSRLRRAQAVGFHQATRAQIQRRSLRDGVENPHIAAQPAPQPRKIPGAIRARLTLAVDLADLGVVQQRIHRLECRTSRDSECSSPHR